MKKPALMVAGALLLTTSLVACGRTEMSSPATPAAVTTSSSLPALTTSPDVMQVITPASVSARQFAEMVGRGTIYEVAAGTIAEEKAQNPLLRAYGKQMVTDHTEMGLALNNKAQIASNNYTLPATLDSKHQALIDQLNAASGAQFDQLYIQQMRQSHKDTYELMNAMADRGSESNFQEFAADYKQTVLDHLNHIDAIAEQISM